jgi:hypothetical protein
MALVLSRMRTLARSPALVSTARPLSAEPMKPDTAAVGGAGAPSAVRSPIASVTLARNNFGHIFRNNPLDG